MRPWVAFVVGIVAGWSLCAATPASAQTLPQAAIDAGLAIHQAERPEHACNGHWVIEYTEAIPSTGYAPTGAGRPCVLQFKPSLIAAGAGHPPVVWCGLVRHEAEHWWQVDSGGFLYHTEEPESLMNAQTPYAYGPCVERLAPPAAPPAPEVHVDPAPVELASDVVEPRGRPARAHKSKRARRAHRRQDRFCRKHRKRCVLRARVVGPSRAGW